MLRMFVTFDQITYVLRYFTPSLVKEGVGMWKTCLLGLPFGLFSCVLLVYLTIGSNPYVIVLKIKNATSQSNLSNFSILFYVKKSEFLCA